MSTIRIAREVANKLFQVEDAIDSALLEACALQSAILSARMVVRTSAELSQESIVSLVKATNTLVQARAELIQTHAAMASTQSKLGMREHNFGGFMDKKAENAFSVVANQEAQRAS